MPSCHRFATVVGLAYYRSVRGALGKRGFCIEKSPHAALGAGLTQLTHGPQSFSFMMARRRQPDCPGLSAASRADPQQRQRCSRRELLVRSLPRWEASGAPDEWVRSPMRRTPTRSTPDERTMPPVSPMPISAVRLATAARTAWLLG